MKKRKRNWYIFRLSVGLAVVVGFGVGFFGEGVSFAEQNQAFRDLRNTAGIVFGVLGAWIALVLPDGLRGIFKSEALVGEHKYRQIDRLLTPMRISTLVLILALFFSWLGPLARANFDVHHGWMRMVSFGVLGACTLLEGFAVIYALAPAEMAGQHAKVKHKKKRRIDNLRTYGGRDPSEALRDTPVQGPSPAASDEPE